MRRAAPPLVAASGADRDDTLALFAKKLCIHSRLSTDDLKALCALPYNIRRRDPDAYIVREGEPARDCAVLLSGLAIRQKVAHDGGRQILALKVPGEALDFQSIYLETADHSLQALTPVVLALVPLEAMEALAATRPAVARAVQRDTLIEASIMREWLLNVGRRKALNRLAHFICELAHRLPLQESPRAARQKKVPFTQEQLADVLGLTKVHVARSLKKLEQLGVVQRGRYLYIVDLTALCSLAHFTSAYLYLGRRARL